MNKDVITVRRVRAWLESLPEEWQDAPFQVVAHGMPADLKRIVAYRAKDGTCKGVVANSMGTHLPFDDSLEWLHSLTYGSHYDPDDDSGYPAIVEELALECRCTPLENRPCDGLLVGGPCDDLHTDGRDEEN